MDSGEPKRSRIRLCSPGGYVGTVINGRFLEVGCRERRCNAGGPHNHLFDLTTGYMVTELVADELPAIAPVMIRERA